MGKEKVFGTCALCRRNNIELMDSHIIPKAIYRRAKSFSNSRFRSLYQPKEILQDGEKKPMLCHECEEFFSYYETKFANLFLDKYLKNNSEVLPKITEDINLYILTVAWRIIYDDLYVYQSYIHNSNRDDYEEYEYKLWRFLFQKYCSENPDAQVGCRENKISKLEVDCVGVMIAKIEELKRNQLPEDMSEVKSYIYTLKELGYSEDTINQLSQLILGYSFNLVNGRYHILSMYKGLAITTVYQPRRNILITNIKEKLRTAILTEEVVREELIKEINWQINRIKEQYSKARKELDESGITKQIIKRYNK